MSEADDMIAVADMRNWHAQRDKRWKLLTHVPNGGLRHPKVGAQLRRQGANAGFPDWILPIKNSAYGGLAIEQKFGRGVLSPEQKEFRELLTENGICWVESRTVEQTLSLVEAHLMLG
jgi:hypothetical protein